MTLALTPSVTQDDTASAPAPSLAVIDAAIMEAATTGAVERLQRLMLLRATTALADLIGAPADAVTAAKARP